MRNCIIFWAEPIKAKENHLAMANAVSYYRVSTGKQEKSGLGLDAQQKSVRDYAERFGLNILQEFTEVESGKNNNRPVLQKALAACRKQKATLLIAKLDRLGRSVALVSALMESKVQFLAVDNPHAEEFLLHILAAVAQYEAKVISDRTKAALQAAKQRGVILGKYGRNVLSKSNHQKAINFAVKMQPIIKRLQMLGYKSVRALARELNKRKVSTYTGKKSRWHHRTVYSLLKRIEQINPA